MITSIRELGRISKESDIDSLLDRIRAKYVLAIHLIAKGTEFSYGGVELEQVKERPARYLYCKDPSGKPALFLSWRVASGEVRNLKKALGKNNSAPLDEFRGKKLAWISKPTDGGYESGLKLLQAFTQTEAANSRLSKVLGCMAGNHGKIWSDLKTKIEEIEPSELLITIKIQENGEWRYPGDYPDFVDVIKRYKLGSKNE